MSILDSFNSFINEAVKYQPNLDHDSKQRSKDALATRGLPTRNEEEWRNTSLKFLSETRFVPATHIPKEIPTDVVQFVDSNKIPGCEYIVFLNGFYVANLSQVNSDWMTVNLGHMNLQNENSAPLEALNEIYNLNAMDVVVNKDVLKPLQILNVSHSLAANSALAIAPKLNLNLKSNKEVKIVLSNVGENGAVYFSNGSFKFTVEKDARLELVNFVGQSEKAYHLDSVKISAEESSTVRYFEMNLKALWTRHNFVLDLNGENIQAEVLGASKLKGQQHCDSQTFINHNKGNCKSEQIYKSLLGDESHSVFCGTVYIAPDIAKADSAQLNQNLLLSDKAEVNSKPVLRIFSDDVKASHGSTMGQIQEEEIFYLQSRCISRSKAVELLGQGFLNEIVFRIGSDELKHYFSEELWH